MKEQSFRHHTRYVPTYHFGTFGALLALLIGSIVLLCCGGKMPWLTGAWMILSSVTMVSVAFHSRLFALRVQDRAIRAEEGLRYFILTGKRLDPRIRMSQIIALRFASDEEFVPLVQRALDEKLRSREIKQAIVNWRTDYYRA